MPRYGPAKSCSDPQPDVMTIEQLFSYLRLSRPKLIELAQEGKVSGQKVGKRWLFKKQIINEWLRGREDGES